MQQQQQQQPVAVLTPATAGWVKLAKDILSGTCGGFAVTFVGHPFDTLKVRLQTQPVNQPLYTGVVDCVKKTLQWEGIGGLYKGVTSPLAGQMFFRATMFGAYGQSKRWLASNPDGSTRTLTAIDFYKAGSLTGFVAAFTECPIDFFKSQIQVQIIRSKTIPDYKAPFTTVTGCVKAALNQNGVRGPFQGLGATILRNSMANGVYLGGFEMLKHWYAQSNGIQLTELPGHITMASAATAGILYWVVVFPVDAIKSTMQTDSIVKAQRKYPNIMTTAKMLWAEGGPKRFYRGFAPCLMRAAPANGVMLSTVDYVSNTLNK